MMMARMAVSQATGGGMTTPLLGSNEEASSRVNSGEKTLAYFAGTLLSGCWAFEYYCYPNVFVLFAAGIGAFFNVFFSYIYIKDKGIANIQETGGQMLNMVGQVAETNKALGSGIGSVAKENERLEHLQKQVESIAEQQGTNVEDLVRLVKRNKEILTEMRNIAKAETVQKLVEMVIESDKDGDFVIDEEEREELYLKLNNWRTYVSVNEKNFYVAIEKAKGEIKGVMEIVKDLLSDDYDDAISDSEKVFIIDDSDIDDGQENKTKKKKKKKKKKNSNRRSSSQT